jgi:RNA polymerase sigma-70 factor, ECF subfamily
MNLCGRGSVTTTSVHGVDGAMAEHTIAGGSGADVQLHLLVLRCQVGDEGAFTRLFALFSSRTLAYLRGLVGDAADDVQQEVWLAVYRGISGLNNPNAFRTWLFRTTRHRAVDVLRREKRERALFLDVSSEDEQVVGVAAHHDTDDFHQPLPAAALAKLSALHREVLQLRYGDDLSYAEIALVVGCSVGTVRSRLHNAKQRLHELMRTQ